VVKVRVRARSIVAAGARRMLKHVEPANFDGKAFTLLLAGKHLLADKQKLSAEIGARAAA
jgi:hypothetical protein